MSFVNLLLRFRPSAQITMVQSDVDATSAAGVLAVQHSFREGFLTAAIAVALMMQTRSIAGCEYQSWERSCIRLRASRSALLPAHQPCCCPSLHSLFSDQRENNRHLLTGRMMLSSGKPVCTPRCLSCSAAARGRYQ
jgi:hypothetical protein